MARAPARGGEYWGCAGCGGRAVTIPVLRKSVSASFAEDLLGGIRGAGERADRLCPFCAARMREFRSPDGRVVVDGCEPCLLVWFDRGEHPEEATAAPERRARLAGGYADGSEGRALAEAYGEMFREQDAHAPRFGETWHSFPALVLLPVETQTPLRRHPWTNWAVLAVLTLVSVAALLGDTERIVMAWGFIPAEAFRMGGLTSVSSFLLHAGWIHLVSNLYFLAIFGDNVEDVLTPGKYLGLLLLTSMAGDLLHLALSPSSTIPSIGASGGISGVMAFYALSFPRARLWFLWWFARGPRFLSISARDGFLIWAGLQILGVFSQFSGDSLVNAVAHLGGAAAGVGLWHRWRERPIPPRLLGT